jgi:glycosyltransferase involved in cell wall biosynthesis
MIDAVAISSVAFTCVLIAYSVAIYPALLSIAARWLRRSWIRSDIQPRVSVIIPAYNEQAVIARKLDNILATKYPTEAFEVLVVSDCSTDKTDAIVRSYAPRVRLIRAQVRSGKQVCLNLAAAQATGDVLLFTDAAGMLSPDAIHLLVRHFADPSIGAASSAVRVRRENPEGEGMYLGADCALRVYEGEISSVVGCVGACYATLRECFRPFHPGDCDDFAAVFNVVARGMRAIMDPQVVCEMSPARNAQVELARKVRTMAGALDTLWRYRRNILRNAPASLLWFLASHKVCRWLIPVSVFWTSLTVTAAAFSGHWTWRIPFAAGLCAAGLGLVALRYGAKNRRLAILKPFGFLVVSICAGVIAWWQVIAGKKQVVWQPTPRLADSHWRLPALQALQTANVDSIVDNDFKDESICIYGDNESTRVLSAVGEKTC